MSAIPSRSNAVYLTARLTNATYHGDHYRVQLEVPTAAAVRLAFRLPAYQRGDEPAALFANALPPLGSPITLTLACDLVAWLPPEVDGDARAT